LRNVSITAALRKPTERRERDWPGTDLPEKQAFDALLSSAGI
jgi:hypothetical protein